MNIDSEYKNELMSDLADSQLSDTQQLAQALDWASSDASVRATWHAYHVIGDTLRANSLANAAGDRAFVEKLQMRLAQESLPTPGAVVQPSVNPARPRTATNLPSIAWVASVGVTAMAAVVLIWNLVGVGGPPHLDADMRLAQQTATPGSFSRVTAETAVTTTAASGPMLRNAQLDELLAAHRQAGGLSALPQPVGLLHDVAFDPSR